MRRLVVIVFLLSLFSPSLPAAQLPQAQPAGSAAAQSPEQQKAPKPADDKAAKPDDSGKNKKDYSQEGFVIEQVRTLYRFEHDGTGRKETIARIRVQSEAGVEQWGQVVIGYSSANERVEIPYVRVRKKDGTVVTAPADSVQDLSAPVAR